MERVLKRAAGLSRQCKRSVPSGSTRRRPRSRSRSSCPLPCRNRSQRPLLRRHPRSTRISAHVEFTDRRLRVLVRASFDEQRHQLYLQPAYSRGSHRAGGACQSEARHPFNGLEDGLEGARASGSIARRSAITISSVDRESLGATLSGCEVCRSDHSDAGSATRRSSSSAAAASFIWPWSSTCLAVRRGLGRERRQ